MLRLPKLLRALLPMRAREPGRFALHGVLLYIDADGRQHVQATDGRRIAAAVLAREEGDDVEPTATAIVDAGDLDQLLRLKSKKNEIRVEVKADRKDRTVPATVAIEAGDAAASLRVLDGVFPPTDSVWPSGKIESRIAVNPDYLIEALKLCKAASPSEMRCAVLTIYGDKRPMVVEPGTLDPSLASLHVVVSPVSINGETRKYPQTGRAEAPKASTDASKPETAADVARCSPSVKPRLPIPLSLNYCARLPRRLLSTR